MDTPDEPLDPFLGDPDDPAAALEALDDADEVREPLSPADREGVLDELADVEVFQALLEPRGVRGLAVDCGDCGDCGDCDERHLLDWALLKADLRGLLDRGTVRVHEPAYDPDPDDYVTWDYARGFTDASLLADDDDGP